MFMNRPLPPPRFRLLSLRRARRTGLVVLALFLGTAVAAFMVARHFHLSVGSTVISVMVSGVAPAGLYLSWAIFWEGRAAEDLTLAEVADELAIAVGSQWRKEASARGLNDPVPLEVSWAAADPSLTESWEDPARASAPPRTDEAHGARRVCGLKGCIRGFDHGFGIGLPDSKSGDGGGVCSRRTGRLDVTMCWARPCRARHRGGCIGPKRECYSRMRSGQGMTARSVSNRQEPATTHYGP